MKSYKALASITKLRVRLPDKLPEHAGVEEYLTPPRLTLLQKRQQEATINLLRSLQGIAWKHVEHLTPTIRPSTSTWTEELKAASSQDDFINMRICLGWKTQRLSRSSRPTWRRGADSINQDEPGLLHAIVALYPAGAEAHPLLHNDPYLPPKIEGKTKGKL